VAEKESKDLAKDMLKLEQRINQVRVCLERLERATAELRTLTLKERVRRLKARAAAYEWRRPPSP
jgi:hypothetical protein